MPSFEETLLEHTQITRSAEYDFLNHQRPQIMDLLVEIKPIGLGKELYERVEKSLPNPLNAVAMGNRLWPETPSPTAGIFRAAFKNLAKISTEPEKYVTERAVIAEIIDLVLPVSRVNYSDSSGLMNFRTYDPKQIGACTRAEEFFANAYKQITTGENFGQGNIDLYHDVDREPFAFQKTKTPSAKLLKPIRVDGVYTPEGTIGYICPDSGIELTGEARIGNATIRSFLINDRLRFRPVRLGPLAYSDLLDQAMFGVYFCLLDKKIAVANEKVDSIYEANLSDFQAATKMGLTACLGKDNVQELAQIAA